MTNDAGNKLPEHALQALRDLLDTLAKERIHPNIDYLPNGDIRCTWMAGVWAASCTITPHWQCIKFVAVKGTEA